MASVSTLPGPALQASKAALSSALAENLKENEKAPNGDQSLEPGEIQEVDMQAQADNIRTVFNDPTNFNVKVRFHSSLARNLAAQTGWPVFIGSADNMRAIASPLLSLDSLVRFTCDQGP